MKKILPTEQDTEKSGAQIAAQLKSPAIIFLEGQLGAGKTTFAKGFLRGLGYQGLVKSPTFTLIETYVLPSAHVVHADLYRLKNEMELENLGLRDYFTDDTIILIEWASRAKKCLPKPTMECVLTFSEKQPGRILEVL